MKVRTALIADSCTHNNQLSTLCLIEVQHHMCIILVQKYNSIVLACWENQFDAYSGAIKQVSSETFQLMNGETT